MSPSFHLLADAPAQLLPARELMAFTLASHIILVPLGVAFPFITLVMQQGQITAEYLERPAPDPAAFGLPTEDSGDRTDALLGQNNRTCVRHVPDVEAIRASRTRVVVARGIESGEELAARSASAVAALLGQDAVMFPGNHAGFLGGEYGQQGDPDAFAAKLREVLDGA